VTDGVDAAVEAVKAARKDSGANSVFADTSGTQLGKRDSPMLSTGYLGNRPVAHGAFPVHLTGKAPGAAIRPRGAYFGGNDDA
jgi:hypothetical protein